MENTTVITREMLQEKKDSIESMFKDSNRENRDRALTISVAGDLVIPVDSISWLKENGYQLEVVETFGPTGVALLVHPA